MSKIYVGDIGTNIELDVGTDVSSATSLAIEVRKPDNTTATWTATVTSNVNKISYLTQSGDLDVAGLYLIQASVTMTGFTGLGQTTSFTVNEAYT